MARAWTCQRVQAGERCRHENPSRKRKCEACGKPRPARKRRSHMVALDLDYEGFIELNGGETCGICGAAPPEGRKLYRDHSHASGLARGLLCFVCNRTLTNRVDNVDWLRRAILYLEGADR